jgi:transposase-like protein
MSLPKGETGEIKRQRKTYSPEFKGRLAIEAIRGFKTINELAAEYGVHPNQNGCTSRSAISRWSLTGWKKTVHKSGLHGPAGG